MNMCVGLYTYVFTLENITQHAKQVISRRKPNRKSHEARKKYTIHTVLLFAVFTNVCKTR